MNTRMWQKLFKFKHTTKQSKKKLKPEKLGVDISKEYAKEIEWEPAWSTGAPLPQVF